MARVKQCEDLSIHTLHHLKTCILHPHKIDELFYAGVPCPHGHRLRHRHLHWCFNCALKIHANRCHADINEINKEHRPYFYRIFSGLTLDQSLENCWELPLSRRPRALHTPRFSYMHYDYPRAGRAISMPLSRLTYALFWGEVGAVTVKSVCGNPYCWNPMHVRSRFNVKSLPGLLGHSNLIVDHNKVVAWDQRETTIEQEKSPKIAIIKPAKENQQVKPGSPFRPLESQYVPDLE
jgi:hypothetical protein